MKCLWLLLTMVMLLSMPACRHEAEKPKDVKEITTPAKHRRKNGNPVMQQYVDYSITPRYFSAKRDSEYLSRLNKLSSDRIHGFVVSPDTFFYRYLNTTFYHAHCPYWSDSPFIILMRDNISGQIYTHEVSSWGYDVCEFMFNPLEVLKFFEDTRIMPCNPSYSDVEAYLNRCIALRSKQLTSGMLDTVLRYSVFAWRIHNADELDRIIREFDDQKLIHSGATQKLLRILKEKVKNGEGLLYSRRDRSVLLYVDYMPDINFSGDKKRTWNKYNEKDFIQHYMGNNYKLRMIFIRL